MSDFNTGVIRPIECFKEGWEIIKAEYWLLFAITIVGALIAGASMLILAGAFYCAIFFCYLKKIDGQPVAFDDLWKGFTWWLPGLGVVAVIFVPVIVEYIFIYLSLVGAIIAGANMGEGGLVGVFVGAFLVHFVIIIAMVCFHTLLVFSFPLIVDRNLGPIQAMLTSAKAVWKNLGGVAGMIGVQFLLILLGYAACIVGVYLIIPIIIAGNMVAYRKVFPRIPGQNFAPPPPGAYTGG